MNTHKFLNSMLLSTIHELQEMEKRAMLHDNLQKLSDKQLRQCRYDARAMVVEPDNGVAEYRLAIIREENRRFFEKRK